MPMTELMRRAVARAARLPAGQQNALATFVLAELDGPEAWEAVFGSVDDDRGDAREEADPSAPGQVARRSR